MWILVVLLHDCSVALCVLIYVFVYLVVAHFILPTTISYMCLVLLVEMSSFCSTCIIVSLFNSLVLGFDPALLVKHCRLKPSSILAHCTWMIIYGHTKMNRFLCLTQKNNRGVTLMCIYRISTPMFRCMEFV